MYQYQPLEEKTPFYWVNKGLWVYSFYYRHSLDFMDVGSSYITTQRTMCMLTTNVKLFRGEKYIEIIIDGQLKWVEFNGFEQRSFPI